MQEQFVNEFMARVTDLISDADLNIVYKQLMIHVSEYDIPGTLQHGFETFLLLS